MAAGFQSLPVIRPAEAEKRHAGRQHCGYFRLRVPRDVTTWRRNNYPRHRKNSTDTEHKHTEICMTVILTLFTSQQKGGGNGIGQEGKSNSRKKTGTERNRKEENNRKIINRTEKKDGKDRRENRTVT